MRRQATRAVLKRGLQAPPMHLAKAGKQVTLHSKMRAQARLQVQPVHKTVPLAQAALP